MYRVAILSFITKTMEVLKWVFSLGFAIFFIDTYVLLVVVHTEIFFEIEPVVTEIRAFNRTNSSAL